MPGVRPFAGKMHLRPSDLPGKIIQAIVIGDVQPGRMVSGALSRTPSLGHFRMVFRDVTIVGVGLIGGSIGLRLVRDKACRRIIGVGRRHTSLRSALDMKAIHEATLDPASAAARSDLVIIATSVGLIPSMIEQIIPACRPGTLVTDVGSIKGLIVDAAAEFRRQEVEFVGAHPIAGSEKRGVAHARAELFEKALCILTPADGEPTPGAERLEAFWRALGAEVVLMKPAEHDRLVAAASHMPHSVAAALAASLPDEAIRCAGAGFRDTTRIAGGDAELWADILMGNREEVLASLERFRESLSGLAGALEGADRAAVRDFLADARQKRCALAPPLDDPDADGAAEQS